MKYQNKRQTKKALYIFNSSQAKMENLWPRIYSQKEWLDKGYFLELAYSYTLENWVKRKCISRSWN